MTTPVTEGSAAQDSIKVPQQNKSQMLGAALAKLAGLGIEDLSHFLNDTLAQVSDPNSSQNGGGVKDAHAALQASLNMHPSAAVKESTREDLANILAEGEDLSEEVKNKTAELFEAAVGARMIIEREELIEEMNTQLEEAYVAIAEEVAQKVEAHLDVVVEQWLTDNEVAIESTLRNEITEDFIEGMKKLFAEHYMTVPEEKVDVVEGLIEQNSELETRLDAIITENAQLKAEKLEAAKNDVVESVCDGLALTQVERLRTLCESVEFNGDLDAFKTKVTMVKENLVAKNGKSASSTGLLTEESDPDAAAKGNAPASVLAPDIRAYADAISRSVRKF